jgi:hypothetical protein
MIIWRCPKDGLDPDFIADLESVVEPDPDPWYVLEGFRSMQRSADLYAAYLPWLRYKQGRGPRPPGEPAPKAAPPGRSAHNFGLAVDLVLDKDAVTKGLQPSWRINDPVDGPKWRRLVAAIEAHPRLNSGADFDDWPHIERQDWQHFIHAERRP